MFNENLESYLKELGWYKKDLAAAADIAPESISRWKQADRFRPSRESLRKIRDALNAEAKNQRKLFRVTIDELLADDR